MAQLSITKLNKLQLIKIVIYVIHGKSTYNFIHILLNGNNKIWQSFYNVSVNKIRFFKHV